MSVEAICRLCGESKSAHAKRASDWRNTPGCSGCYVPDRTTDCFINGCDYSAGPMCAVCGASRPQRGTFGESPIQTLHRAISEARSK